MAQSTQDNLSNAESPTQNLCTATAPVQNASNCQNECTIKEQMQAVQQSGRENLHVAYSTPDAIAQKRQRKAKANYTRHLSTCINEMRVLHPSGERSHESRSQCHVLEGSPSSDRLIGPELDAEHCCEEFLYFVIILPGHARVGLLLGVDLGACDPLAVWALKQDGDESFGSVPAAYQFAVPDTRLHVLKHLL